jgi:hypothetical protein
LKCDYPPTYVNARQSRLERRTKYRFLKYTGLVSPTEADRLKDWTYPHIIQYLYMKTGKELKIDEQQL